MTQIIYTSQLGWCIPLQIEDSKCDLLTTDDLRHLERYVPPAAVVEDQPVEDIPMAPVDVFNPPQWPAPANDRPQAGPGPKIYDQAARPEVEPTVSIEQWLSRHHSIFGGDKDGGVYFSPGEIARIARGGSITVRKPRKRGLLAWLGL